MEEDMEKTEETTAEENEDEGRPPVDPNNKLYTFLSLLIFAVIYTAYQLISQNISLSYAVYEDDPSEASINAVLDAVGAEQLPEGCELQYMRMHRNFDGDTIYVSVSLPDDDEDSLDLDELAAKYIPYRYGDGASDERFAVYPYADMTADYVYGNSYISVEDPSDSCIVFQDGDGYTAVFRTTKYDAHVRESFKDGIRINVK